MEESLTCLDLFSGIGGFHLGLNKVGFKTIAFCENDKYASRVLNKNYPNIPNIGDITKIKTFPKADVICGGFPCQDISIAGKMEGIKNGKKSSLWKEYSRAIFDVRPKYVIIENVANLLNTKLGILTVMQDLAEIGYNARWDIISAASFGFPHLRKRLWIVAYPNSKRWSRFLQYYTYAIKSNTKERLTKCSINTNNPFQYEDIPQNIRVDDGLPYRTHRARCLGNAIIPDIAECIGKSILYAHGRMLEVE